MILGQKLLACVIREGGGGGSAKKLELSPPFFLAPHSPIATATQDGIYRSAETLGLYEESLWSSLQ